MKTAATTLMVLLLISSPATAQNVCNQFQPVSGRCNLNATPVEQAKCLLRPVKKFANLGAPLTALPAPLDRLVGQPTSSTLSTQQVTSFLSANNIREQDVGGSLSIALTRPRYFVIHDTSDFLSGNSFPANINSENFSPNNIASRAVNAKICHVYVDRLGRSATAVRFEPTAPPSGTKFGRCNSAQKPKFLHIENVQPRIRDTSVAFQNDAIGPTPGFTESQLERLALLYIIASVRKGNWLIPAYHAPIDLGFRNAHDDPQNFNLDNWASQLDSLINRITSSTLNRVTPATTERLRNSKLR